MSSKVTFCDDNGKWYTMDRKDFTIDKNVTIASSDVICDSTKNPLSVAYKAFNDAYVLCKEDCKPNVYSEDELKQIKSKESQIDIYTTRIENLEKELLKNQNKNKEDIDTYDVIMLEKTEKEKEEKELIRVENELKSQLQKFNIISNINETKQDLETKQAENTECLESEEKNSLGCIIIENMDDSITKLSNCKDNLKILNTNLIGLEQSIYKKNYDFEKCAHEKELYKADADTLHRWIIRHRGEDHVATGSTIELTLSKNKRLISASQNANYLPKPQFLDSIMPLPVAYYKYFAQVGVVTPLSNNDTAMRAQLLRARCLSVLPFKTGIRFNDLLYDGDNLLENEFSQNESTETGINNDVYMLTYVKIHKIYTMVKSCIFKQNSNEFKLECNEFVNVGLATGSEYRPLRSTPQLLAIIPYLIENPLFNEIDENSLLVIYIADDYAANILALLILIDIKKGDESILKKKNITLDIFSTDKTLFGLNQSWLSIWKDRNKYKINWANLNKHVDTLTWPVKSRIWVRPTPKPIGWFTPISYDGMANVQVNMSQKGNFDDFMAIIRSNDQYMYSDEKPDDLSDGWVSMDDNFQINFTDIFSGVEENPVFNNVDVKENGKYLIKVNGSEKNFGTIGDKNISQFS